MKPVFGLLLIGGGIMLMYGLFTGKINFPGYGSGSGGVVNPNGPLGTPTPVNKSKPVQVNVPEGQNPVNASCPKGQHLAPVYVRGSTLAHWICVPD